MATLTKPSLNGGSIAGVSLVDFSYPGALFGLGVALLAYMQWRYSLLVASPLDKYHKAVLAKLDQRMKPHPWLAEHLRNGAVDTVISPSSNDELAHDPKYPHFIPNCEALAIDHWCQEYRKNDIPVATTDGLVCRLSAFPGFSTSTFSERDLLCFNRARTDVEESEGHLRSGDEVATKFRCELLHDIRPLPITKEIKAELQHAKWEVRLGDRSFSDEVLPHLVALFAWVAIALQSSMFVLAGFQVGAFPAQEGLLYDLWSFTHNCLDALCTSIKLAASIFRSEG